MSHPAETPRFSEPEPEPQPTTEQEYVPNASDLTLIAQHLDKGRDYVASFTSFLGSDMFSFDKALQMLGLSNVDDARKKLQEITARQTEIVQSNIETTRNFGNKVIAVAAALNPLHYINRK